MSVQSKVIESKVWPKSNPDVVYWETEVFEHEAQLAARFITSWWVADHKYIHREDVIKTAFDMAEDFMKEAKKRGHIHVTPDLPEPEEKDERSQPIQ